MKRFLSILTSEKGPITPFDKNLFQEILAFFSAEGPQEDQKSSKKQQQQICYEIKSNVPTEESVEDILDWNDSLPASNGDAVGHETENIIPSKRVKSKSKKIKSIVIDKETNITGTNQNTYFYVNHPRSHI